MFSQAIDDFLKSDNIGMQQANFSTTRYIAQLLIQKKNIQQIYKEMTDKENQCEEIITQIIDNKYSQFNPMVNKPKIYGQAYEKLSQSVKQNRRRLSKAKQILRSKSIELKQHYYQSIFNKEIIFALKKLKNIRQSIRLIQMQALTQPYEACLECRKTKQLMSTFPKQDTHQLQYLNKSFSLGVSQILGEFQSQIREYFFGARNSPFQNNEAQKYYDAEKKIREYKNLSDVMQCIKQYVPDITLPRDEELGLCLIDSKLDDNELTISYNQLKKFIQMSFTFNDFDAVRQYLDNNTQRNGDIDISVKLQNGLLNLFLCVRGCMIIKKTNELLNKHFEDFKNNMQDLFTKSLTIFIRKCNLNESTKFSLFGELNFSSFQTYKIVGEFFKKLIAHAMILLRKQVLFGKILHHLKIDVDENTLLLSLSELCRQLFWQINVTLSMFYKAINSNEQGKAREVFDVRNEFHLFIQAALQTLIKPSPLYYLLQRHLLNEVLLTCVESLKTFMRVEPIFKEPIDNEIILQQELSKSIYLDCIKQLSEGIKNVVKNIVSARKKINKTFVPQINYELAVDIQDQQLKAMLNNFQMPTLKMMIPEAIQFTYLINELSVINQVTNLQEDFIRILNWIINIFLQEIKIKLKSCIQGSQSETLLYNQDKQAVLKKLLSYMEWKCKFQQSNPLLNDGINTQSRVHKAKSDKIYRSQLKQAFYQGYKEFLINQIDEQKISPLIKSKEILHTLGSLHDNIKAFLDFVKVSIGLYLDKIDKQQLVRELEIQQKDIPQDSQDSKFQILKIFQLRCEQQSFQIDQFKNKNAYDLQFDDNYQQSIFRFLKLYNDIFQIQLDTYMILRFEFHMRSLVMTNISDFSFDYLNFSSALKECLLEDSYSLIVSDFWTVFKGSLKSQFIRSKDYNPKNIQMILKDLNVMKEEIGEKGKRISHLRRYFKLYLVNKQDLEKFLKINAYKYKFDQILEYCRLQKLDNPDTLKRYCI